MIASPVKPHTSLKALVALTHPIAVVAWSCATVLFSFVAVRGIPEMSLLIRLVIVVAASQVCIGATNEYCDAEVDRQIKPWRPIPSGQVSPRSALVMAIISAVLMLAGAVGLGLLGIAGALVGTFAGLAHNFWLKRTLFSWLPFAVGYSLHPAGIWVIFGRFSPPLLPLLFYGLPLILGIHLADQLPDIAERKFGIRGAVHRLGPFWGPRLTVIILLCAPLALLVPVLPRPLDYRHGLLLIGMLVYYISLGLAIRMNLRKPGYRSMKQGFIALELGLMTLIPLYFAAGMWP